MHNTSYKSVLARRACRYSDARPPRKTDGVLLESEIPPHMRGKAAYTRNSGRTAGITPAYAGKRSGMDERRRQRKDHPRVCGEKPNRILWEHWKEGSPPRMRGKVPGVCDDLARVGITPAYAGKRTPCRNTSLRYWDHPRVCGEKHSDETPKGDMVRITPAYAGKR